MEEFSFYQPTRLKFGDGKLDMLGEIVKRYGTRCLLVTTSNEEEVLRPLYDRVKQILDRAGVYVYHFDEVVPNPSIQGIEKAIDIFRSEKLEVIAAVGGGSSIDTAKAISLFGHVDTLDWDIIFRTYTDAFADYEPLGVKVPVVAVPTTAGTGSEMTQAMVLSIPDKNEKMCIFHPDAFTNVALVDPELTRTLPPRLTAVTGFDAFTHSFESYIRECASNYTRTLALKSIQMIVNALPRLVKDTANMQLRSEMSQAASFSGISLSNAAASIPHPLSEIVGGIAPRISHGQCLASLYPAYIDYIWEQEVEKCACVSRIFDCRYESASDREAAAALPQLIRDFLNAVGINKSFSELGLTEQELKAVVEHPVLSVLPFAPQEVLQKIIIDSYK